MNQGCKVTCLLQTDELDKAEKLLLAYADDVGTSWFYKRIDEKFD